MLYCGRLWLVLEQVERRNVGQKESKSGFLSVSNFFFDTKYKIFCLSYLFIKRGSLKDFSISFLVPSITKILYENT